MKSSTLSHIKLGKRLYALAGIPKVTNEYDEVSGIEIIRYVTSLICLTYRNAFNTYVVFFSSPATNDNISKQYVSLQWIINQWLAMIFFVLIILRHRFLKRIFAVVDEIETKINSFRDQRTMDGFIITGIALMHFINLIFIFHDEIIYYKVLYSKFPNTNFLFLIVLYIITSVQYKISVCIVQYNWNLIIVESLKISRKFRKHVFTTTLQDDLTTVLPVVEVDTGSSSRACYCAHRSSSSHRCSPWYRRLHHCRKMCKMYIKAKKLSVAVNKVYFPVATMLMIGFSLAFSVMFFEMFSKRYEYLNAYSIFSLPVAKIFWIVPLFTPIVINSFTKYSGEGLVREASREVFATEDASRRKIIARLVNSVSDTYPDNLWCLYDIHWSILSVLLDFGLLLGTTFVSPQDSD
ncbi:hypothetical protein J6590_090399 [Homalodisca vitripennis]|nr:hypothetical protein J6590_090399 [Homalodisca vitripennis]